MKTNQPTIKNITAMFRCSPEQVRNQYARNIRQLETILAKARTVNGKYRGLTASQWSEKIAAFKAKAVIVCAS